MSLSRRDFLKAAALSAGAAPWGWMQALAATTAASDDYRALVCIFLYGGNDGNNMLVPTDTSGYAAYSSARGALALGTTELTTLGTAGATVGVTPGPAVTTLGTARPAVGVTPGAAVGVAAASTAGTARAAPAGPAVDRAARACVLHRVVSRPLAAHGGEQERGTDDRRMGA